MKNKVLGIFMCMLLIFVTIFPVSGIMNIGETEMVDIDKNNGGNHLTEKGNTAIFIANFMSPERDPYPFDVIISDGDWRQEWQNVTYINTSVPSNATYTFRYIWNNSIEVKFRLPLHLWETKTFEFYAHDPDQIKNRTRPYILFEEDDAIDSLSWNWEPDTQILTWNITHWSNKYNGIMANLGDPEFGIVKFTCAANDTAVCGYLEDKNGKKKHFWCSNATPITPDLTQNLLSIQYSEIPSDQCVLDLGYPIYNDAMITKYFNHILQTIDGIQYPSNFFDPNYIIPPGHYLCQLGDIQDEYAPLELPLDISAGEWVNFEWFPLRIIDLNPFYFSIVAENIFSNSAYSNLTHDMENKTIMVDLSTKTEDDWWGCFCVPDTTCVNTLTAYINDTPFEMNRCYNYTINRVGNYNIVVVRIDSSVTSLKLDYGEDSISPIFEKVRPKGIYIFDKEIIQWKPNLALVLGKVNISAELIDNESFIGRVEFYINLLIKMRKPGPIDEPEFPPYYLWKEISFGMNTITMIAYDNAENTATTEIKVLKFF